jgi:hypothetical protein
MPDTLGSMSASAMTPKVVVAEALIRTATAPGMRGHRRRDGPSDRHGAGSRGHGGRAATDRSLIEG